MTTVVNNPSGGDGGGNGMGMIFGLVALVVVAFLFFYFGLPALRQSGTPTINVPDTIDVNINPPSQ